MSGKPTQETVTDVVEALDKIAILEAEIEELRPKANRMRTAETEVANLKIRLKKILSSADLETNGNYGFEARLAWFLQEMRRQVKTEGQK